LSKSIFQIQSLENLNASDNSIKRLDFDGILSSSIKNLDVSIVALSDTVGVSNLKNINLLFKDLIPEFPSVEFGAHLHSTPQTAKEKINPSVIFL
jgi:isopropylmalate/homocitrate/citramalate synthase